MKRKKLSELGVISNIIVKSVYSKMPKTRYTADALAFVFMRKYFGNEVCDKILMNQFQ